jgi:hypothetical protein
MEILPPVLSLPVPLVEPADIVIEPPIPAAAPSPDLIVIDPDDPPVVESTSVAPPVIISMFPLSPFCAVPVDMVTLPLSPLPVPV